MSVSAISSIPPAAPAPVVAPPNARAVGGDFKKPGAQTAQVKDSDGDYKPVSASPAASSSSAVQSALATLQAGG